MGKKIILSDDQVEMVERIFAELGETDPENDMEFLGDFGFKEKLALVLQFAELGTRYLKEAGGKMTATCFCMCPSPN